MTISPDISGKLAIDAKSINDLHLMARKNPDEALKKVSQQFEALFMQMLLKNMREASPKEGLFDSQQMKFFTQMYDQQLAQKMATKGIGLANVLTEQLAKQTGQQQSSELQAPLVSQTDALLSVINTIHQSAVLGESHPGDKSRELWSATPPSAIPVTTNPTIENRSTDRWNSIIQSELPAQSVRSRNNPTAFIDRLLPHAQAASQSTGIPSHFMLAQAALESGWGKHEIRRADNSPSYNLFGIKAGANWKGDVVETVTTEFVNGVSQKTVEKFRAYNSYAEGFNDYINLLQGNPRYAKVLESSNASAFANNLQRAGYATDPAYAQKLLRVMNSDALQSRNII